MGSESADVVMLLSVAHLTPLHVSSWELSGDEANYPVYTSDVITPLWEGTCGVFGFECVDGLITGSSVKSYWENLEASQFNEAFWDPLNVNV